MRVIYLALNLLTMIFLTSCNNCSKGLEHGCYLSGYDWGKNDKEKGNDSDAYGAWTFYKAGDADARDLEAVTGGGMGCFEDGYEDGYKGKSKI